MKSVISSFSMTLAQAQALQDATKRVKNRSAWINAAITAKILAIDAFSIGDVGDMQLILHFHHRFCNDCDDPHLEFHTCPTFQTLTRIAK